MTKRKTVVTIGICVRNGERTILNALKSLNAQKFPKDLLEIIIVDDGSTDNTLEIVRSFAENSDIQVKIYTQGWKGIASARNLVIREVKGKYIIWVDADMMLPEDYVIKLVEFMELHPNVGATRGQYGIIKSKKLVAMLENCRTINLWSPLPRLWGTGGAIYRVSALKEIGGFDERIKGAGEDIDVLIRLQKKGWVICSLDVKFYEHYKETWGELWKQYFWWGYGAHFISHKHENFINVISRLPIVAFIAGILRLLKIFKYESRLIYLLLPIHEVFKKTSWLMGFIIGHFDGYGHKA